MASYIHVGLKSIRLKCTHGALAISCFPAWYVEQRFEVRDLFLYIALCDGLRGAVVQYAAI